MQIVRQHINEKFTQDSDPISDMGIGAIALIKKIERYNLLHYYTAINDDELELFKKFFKTGKKSIFFIVNSSSMYAEKIDRIVSLKSSKLIFEKNLEDSEGHYFIHAKASCYETKYGKIVISEADTTSSDKDHLKWYLCDINFAVYMDNKYNAFS